MLRYQRGHSTTRPPRLSSPRIVARHYVGPAGDGDGRKAGPGHRPGWAAAQQPRAGSKPESGRLCSSPQAGTPAAPDRAPPGQTHPQPGATAPGRPRNGRYTKFLFCSGGPSGRGDRRERRAVRPRDPDRRVRPPVNNNSNFVDRNGFGAGARGPLGGPPLWGGRGGRGPTPHIFGVLRCHGHGGPCVEG